MSNLKLLLTLLLACLLILSQSGLPVGAAAGDTTRISVSSSGVEANSGSGNSSISANGRYIAFVSAASNLVNGDTNNAADIFVRDMQTNTTTRISVSSNGAEANGDSFNPSISADGRYVAFQSNASNLVAGDTNGAADIFVRDMQTNTTTRISVSSNGAEANSFSSHPSISADGRYVAFQSYASNLVAGDTNETWDIFVRDTQTGTTSRVSVSSSGAEANRNSSDPSISANGRYVAFVSQASNLVSGDTNERQDIFMRDMQTNTTTRVSLNWSGAEASSFSSHPSISADGRYVAFESEADNLVSGDSNERRDIFLRDTQANTTIRISFDSSGAQANDGSYWPSISTDGRYVAFYSFASNLVGEDTNAKRDIFVRDTQTNTTIRISVSSSGDQANGDSFNPSISADGRYIAFDSAASNLVNGDENGISDVFVHECTILALKVFLPLILR